MPNYYRMTLTDAITQQVFAEPPPLRTYQCTMCENKVIGKAEYTAKSYGHCNYCGETLCNTCFADNTKTFTCANCTHHICMKCVTAYALRKTCEKCNASICTGCIKQCTTCSKIVCKQCFHTCECCNSSYCTDHIARLSCGHYTCSSCVTVCSRCHAHVCSSCSGSARNTRKRLCNNCSFMCRSCRYRFSNSVVNVIQGLTFCPECARVRREDLARLQAQQLMQQRRAEVASTYSSEQVPNDLKVTKGSYPRIPTMPHGYTCPISFAPNACLGTMEYSTVPSTWPLFKKKHEIPLYLGVEWELNFSDLQELAIKRCVEQYLSGSYIWKRDGSIGSGAELVLAPRTLQCYTDLNLYELCKDLRLSGASGFYYGQCGIHIHVSNNVIPITTIKKVMAWFMVNRKFIRRFSKRTKESLNRWARIPWHLATWFEGRHDDLSDYYNRHIAINRTDCTWEFRVFRSTTHYERIKATLHFVQAIIDFANLHSFAICSSEHGFNAFMQYLTVTSEHQFLLDYITAEKNLYTQKVLSLGTVELIPSSEEFAPDLVPAQPNC